MDDSSHDLGGNFRKAMRRLTGAVSEISTMQDGQYTVGLGEGVDWVVPTA